MFVGVKVAPYLTEQYREARALRRSGKAIKQIAGEVGVSAGSVHRWTADIELTSSQRDSLDANVRDARVRRSEQWSRRWREWRSGFQEQGRDRAREGDGLHQAGCMLYWAEGSKDRNTLVFANSDLAMMVFFKRFLVQSLGVVPDRFSMRLNVYLGNGLSIDEIERTWLEALELPSDCVRKHTVDHTPTSSSGRRKKKLMLGVCTLKLRRSTPELQHIYGAIQEYAGFDEPAWLD